MQQRILDALRGGANDDAVAAAREFATQSPDDPTAHRLLATALGASGDADGARAAVQRALALAPEDADLHFLHAGLLLGSDRRAEAGQALSTSVGLDPNKLGAYILQAQLALGRNDLDEVERVVRVAARIAPDHPGLQAVKGTLAQRRGDPDEAIRMLSQAAARAPDEPQLRMALGFAYLAKGHLAFAEEAFRGVLKSVPGGRQLHALLAQLQLRQGRPRDAADELAPLLADSALATPGLQRFAGELELAAGRPERALPMLRQALAAVPADRRLLTAIVEAWRRTGDVEDARRTLDAALASAPEVDMLWRARLGFAEGPDVASALIERWLQARPQSVAALEDALAMYAAKGDLAAAEDVARKIVALEPGHTAAELRLVDAAMRDAPTQAVAHIERLLLQAGAVENQRLLRAWLGLAHDRAGNREQAVALWSTLQAETAPQRLPLPMASPPRTCPPRVEPEPGAPEVGFLVGAPGSLVENVAMVLSTTVEAFRSTRFGPQPPLDLLQAYSTPARLDAGELAPADVVASWRALLPVSSRPGEILDWLLWWDNAFAAVLRECLPHATLLVALRDPRDMLLDWLAFAGPVPLAMPSTRVGAAWLAQALDHVATLHEQDLVPHTLLRMDDLVDDASGLADALSAALDMPMPQLQPGALGPRHFAPGHWRNYAGVLADEFALLAPVAARLGYPET